MKPISVGMDAETSLRFENLHVHYGNKNRSETQRMLIRNAERRAKVASCFFTDNLDWIKEDAFGFTFERSLK